MQDSELQTLPENDRFLKLKEVGEWIRRDEKTVRRYMSKGLLPAPHRIGRSLMLRFSDVQAALDRLKVNPAEGWS
ncbi:MAG: helix-turn-helix transcriptional regulator [Verrucomicrobiales bacterium]